jgi:hypothetical protein
MQRLWAGLTALPVAVVVRDHLLTWHTVTQECTLPTTDLLPGDVLAVWRPTRALRPGQIFVASSPDGKQSVVGVATRTTDTWVEAWVSAGSKQRPRAENLPVALIQGVAVCVLWPPSRGQLLAW